MEFLDKHESIRRVTVEDLLNIKESRARELLQSMNKKNLLKKVESGPSLRYTK